MDEAPPTVDMKTSGLAGKFDMMAFEPLPLVRVIEPPPPVDALKVPVKFWPPALMLMFPPFAPICPPTVKSPLPASVPEMLRVPSAPTVPEMLVVPTVNENPETPLVGAILGAVTVRVPVAAPDEATVSESAPFLLLSRVMFPV